MLFLESDMLAVTISSPLLRYPLPWPRNMSWKSTISLEKWCCLVHLLKKVRPTLLIRLVAQNLAELLKPQLHLPSLNITTALSGIVVMHKVERLGASRGR